MSYVSLNMFIWMLGFVKGGYTYPPSASPSSFGWVGDSLVFQGHAIDSDLFDVFLYSVGGALATGIGVLPFYFLHFERLSKFYVGIANSVAAGVMIAASIGLMAEGFQDHHENALDHTLIGVAIGLSLIHFCHLHFDGSKFDVGALKGADAHKACLVLSIMTIHSFAEGLGIGVSFCGMKGSSLGRVMAIAIGLHNIPEGLCIALILLPRGESVRRSIFYAILSSVPQPIISVPAFLLVSYVHWLLPFGFGIAAGAMLWLVISEIIPDALSTVSPSTVATTLTLSMAVMMKVQDAVHQMEYGV